MRMNRIVNLNLRAKLILLYFLTIFIPLLVTGQIILSVSGKKIIEQTTSITQESSTQTALNVQDRLGGYVDIVNRLSVDQTLINYLNPDRVYASELESIDAYDLYLKPVTFYDFNYKNPLAKLNILFLNATLLQDHNIFIFADDEARARRDYREAVQAGGKLVWGVSGDEVFVARSVYNIKKRLTAVISMQVPEDSLYALISESKMSDKIAVIADGGGNVISSNDRELVGRSVADRTFFRPDAAAPFEVRDSADGRSYKVIVGKLGGSSSLPDWRILTLVPIDHLIDDERKIRQTGLLVMGLGLVVSCGIFLLALGRITDRVKALVKKMQTVKNGELSLLQDEGAQDEIGALTRNFNGMIENLQRSIYENYEVNLKLKDITIKKQEAELYALQNQIHPHFLFNTLESIRMGLHNQGDEETATIVMNFANLFRHLLHWQGEFIPLREEIDLVRKYLTIQKYRFRERIQYELEIEPGLAEALIPKLTLQPLVENAVKHGAESTRSGRIRVSVRAAGDGTMVAAIVDNGKGIPPEQLARIRRELADPEIKKSGSIGLKNVHDRIHLHFGPEYGVTIDSPAEEGGTLVRVTMPIRSAKDGTEGGNRDVQSSDRG
ncbi:cache domain-containing sensor histidine kinase [Cohnella zeiphila]|uniref:histidine kinase n=1 Tax=Cohnella zeiphila TaxID=2761120 RepID=A0A7X0SLP9_9BACL|nr:sensor histidine kinase [Cohnella zeiphila]MBB6732199.1 sensor histidine kinase [Cohnella zeiphila]